MCIPPPPPHGIHKDYRRSYSAPPYKEVTRGWEKVFVIMGVRFKRNPIITNLWENNQNLRWIGIGK